MTDSSTDSIDRYFRFLADSFPVMCASDEFHFLPRVRRATELYDLLDDLDRDRIQDRIARLKTFRNAFEQLNQDEMTQNEKDFDTRADLEVLTASSITLLGELEELQDWRHNPLLYLKIAFIGLDHALNKPALSQDEPIQRFRARLSAVPRLLRQATRNIQRVPAEYLNAARDMVLDGLSYLRDLERDTGPLTGQWPTTELAATKRALEAFGRFLNALEPAPHAIDAKSVLAWRLTNQFCCRRSLDEIYDIARQEWDLASQRLQKLAAGIDPNRPWSSLYHDYRPRQLENTDTFSLYRNQIQRLKTFFRDPDFPGIEQCQPLDVCETPAYLRSVRSAASFSAACSGHQGERDLFYITTESDRKRSPAAHRDLKHRLHREYQFLTAHETVPGHHLLDSVRRSLTDPVRGQIESPLFYEGWAYYAESLLFEYGYAESPLERLVDAKRRLWRAARCLIDVGLNRGKMSQDEARSLLVQTGLNPEDAELQVNRFRLNPGYQVCYTLGRFEIEQLRSRHEPKMGRDRFHRILLEGGELPFHLVDERFEAFTE